MLFCAQCLVVRVFVNLVAYPPSDKDMSFLWSIFLRYDSEVCCVFREDVTNVTNEGGYVKWDEKRDGVHMDCRGTDEVESFGFRRKLVLNERDLFVDDICELYAIRGSGTGIRSSSLPSGNLWESDCQRSDSCPISIQSTLHSPVSRIYYQYISFPYFRVPNPLFQFSSRSY